MVSFREAFSGKRFICLALTVLHSIHNTVGWAIASIHDLGGIITSALCTSVNMSPRVVYIGYRPPYCTICITHLCQEKIGKEDIQFTVLLPST